MLDCIRIVICLSNLWSEFVPHISHYIIYSEGMWFRSVQAKHPYWVQSWEKCGFYMVLYMQTDRLHMYPRFLLMAEQCYVMHMFWKRNLMTFHFAWNCRSHGYFLEQFGITYYSERIMIIKGESVECGKKFYIVCFYYTMLWCGQWWGYLISPLLLCILILKCLFCIKKKKSSWSLSFSSFVFFLVELKLLQSTSFCFINLLNSIWVGTRILYGLVL